jgi:NAD(P)-dependent dehydrogenase (short-subunit alcohol dehydrogenase family)
MHPGEWETHLYGLPRFRWDRLRDRSYWVTGAGTGYGRAIATGLASAGAQVFLTGRRAERLHETVAALEAFGVRGHRCHCVPADLTDPAQVEGAASAVDRIAGVLHGVVNNAAAPQRTTSRWPLQQESGGYWDDLMAINLKAHWRVTKAALPLMVKSGEIKVLFMTSGAGWSFAAGYGHYNVSKCGLNSLSACFAEECAACYPHLDVQINALDPGEAHTEMNQGSSRDPASIVQTVLVLLSHPDDGPNGRFFRHDGEPVGFCSALPYLRPLL